MSTATVDGGVAAAVLFGAAAASCAANTSVQVPWRDLSRALVYTAAAESDFNVRAVGDGGDSKGCLQFWERTAKSLPVPWRWDWRFDPTASGYAAVLYVNNALKVDPTWIDRLTGGPQTWPAWRVLWRYGYGGYQHADGAQRVRSEQSFIRNNQYATLAANEAIAGLPWYALPLMDRP